MTSPIENNELRERLLTILQEPREDMTTPKTDRVLSLIEQAVVAAVLRHLYLLRAIDDRSTKVSLRTALDRAIESVELQANQGASNE